MAGAGSGRDLFLQLAGPGTDPSVWDAIGGSVGVYLHRCERCGELRAHWDCE